MKILHAPFSKDSRLTLSLIPLMYNFLSNFNFLRPLSKYIKTPKKLHLNFTSIRKIHISNKPTSKQNKYYEMRYFVTTPPGRVEFSTTLWIKKFSSNVFVFISIKYDILRFRNQVTLYTRFWVGALNQFDLLINYLKIYRYS